jgi:hypothetical protein
MLGIAMETTTGEVRSRWRPGSHAGGEQARVAPGDALRRHRERHTPATRNGVPATRYSSISTMINSFLPK